MRQSFIFPIFFSLFFLSVSSNFSLADTNKTASTNPPVTTSDPGIPLDELEDMLYPMTSDELLIEAEGWLTLLKKTTTKISRAQLDIKRKNKLIEKKKETSKTTTSKKIEEQTKESITAETETKSEMLDDINVLQAERIERVDRLNVILSATTKKMGKTDKGIEPDEVLHYRRYIKAISGVQVDVTDMHAAWVNIYGWLISGEGGLRWLANIIQFILLLLVFWLLSRVLGKGVRKALELSPSNSTILNDFIVSSTRRLIFIIGILIGLSALEINVGPVLAIIGAAGFVVAFALQSTLSNFASGIMIMFYRPFDVGDLIDVTGIFGRVKSMTLVSTSVLTLDHKLMVVPNNQIWGNTIINATNSTERRVDMLFGIGYADNIEHAKQVMDKILADHPKVLSSPEPVVRLHELGDSSVNFICRPWVRTADYWDVYWDVTQQVKERFDAEGITIPFPQRDIHIHNETA
jgi:small conductance mechanosensitive channel